MYCIIAYNFDFYYIDFDHFRSILPQKPNAVYISTAKSMKRRVAPFRRSSFRSHDKKRGYPEGYPLFLNYNAYFNTKVSWCILVHFVVVVHFKQLFRFIAFFLPKRSALSLLIPLLQRYLFPYQLFVNRNHFACM